MQVFSKVDKKVLLTSIAILVVVLLIGLMIYQYMAGSAPEVKNSLGGIQTENNSVINPDNQEPVIEAPEVQIQAGEIQVETKNSSFLSVCLDECGNGICQKVDTNCEKDPSLNCICPETQAECPQDCK